MNIRLKTLLTEAEERLGAPDQARLADLVQAFVANHHGPADFDESELAHLVILDTEPFNSAHAVDMAVLLERPVSSSWRRL